MRALLLVRSAILVAVVPASHGSVIDRWLSSYCATFFDYGLGYYNVLREVCMPLVIAL
jgi:hypothetical protein